MHVAITFLVWLYAWRNSRALFWAVSPLVLSLWVSTVYLRYHYLIDVVAGLVLAPPSFFLANWLFRRFGSLAISVTVPAKWADRLGQFGVINERKA
jgi:membrane-associated phospholipid phosphatase